MTEDGQQPAPPPWQRARPPEGRPTWVMVLAFAMLVFGGQLLLKGASMLTVLKEGAAALPADPSVPPIARELQAAPRSLFLEHPRAVAIDAVAKIVFALLLLLSVASIFSSDPRARRTTILTAWVGIVYQLGDAIFLLAVVRKGVVAIAPALVTTVAGQSGPGVWVPTAGTMISLYDGVMVAAGVLGIVFSVILLKYFGGAKGRLFFGVTPELGRQPHHGG